MRIVEGVGPELRRLVEAGWNDPWSGSATPSPVERLVVGRGLIGQAATLLPKATRTVIVADTLTWDAAGEGVVAALGERAVGPIVLDNPAASMATVEGLAAQLVGADLAVAVGSGTVNDVVKAAAFRAGIPYAVVGTAASMNGYVTATSSLMDDCLKISLKAAAPVAVLLDLDVLAVAPQALTRAGLGDALCRTTVQTDAWLAAEFRNEPYTAAVFDLQRAAEARLLDDPAACVGSPEGLRPLVELLLLGGFSMLIWGGSAAASQGEHLIAHVLEMTQPPGLDALHGAQIGVSSITMARLHDRLFAVEPPVLRASGETWFGRAKLLTRNVEEARGFLAQKSLDEGDAERLTAAMAKRWPALRQARADFALPASQLVTALQAAGCATDASSLGIAAEGYAEAVRGAPAARARWGALDLVAHCEEGFATSTLNWPYQ